MGKRARVVAWAATVALACAASACALFSDLDGLSGSEERADAAPPEAPLDGAALRDAGGGASDAASDAPTGCRFITADFCADFDEPATDADVPFGFTSAVTTPNGSLVRSTETAASGPGSLLAAIDPSDAGENLAFLVHDFGEARQLVTALEVDVALFVPTYAAQTVNVVNVLVGNANSGAADASFVLSVGQDETGSARATLLEVYEAPDGGRSGTVTGLQTIPKAGAWSRLRFELAMSPPRLTLTVDGAVAVNKVPTALPPRRDVVIALGVGGQDDDVVSVARQIRHDDVVVRLR